MELWIRSQDREKLVLAKELYVFSNEPMTNKTYKIVNNYNENLGIYKIKERALEVLDEIQKMLQPQMILSKVEKPIAETCDGTVYVSPNEYEIKELSTYVYEMPEE